MSFLRDLRGARSGGQVSSPAGQSWRIAWRWAGDAWRWWLAELGACVPAGLMQRLFGPGNVVVLRLDGEMLHVTGQPDLPLDSAVLPDALRHHLRQADALALLLPAASVLRRVIDVPSAAAREMAKAVPFLVERHTPFLPGQARAAWRIKSQDRAGRTAIELAVTARHTLERVLNRLLDLDMPISNIHVDGDDRLPRLDFSAATRMGGRRGWLREPWRPLLAATLGLLLFGPAAVSVALHHRALAVQAALAASGARPAEDARLRAILAHQVASATVLAGRMADPSPLRLLHDITDALPDSAWLFSLDATPATVQIAGFSTDLPAVIARLQALPEVAHLEFRSPVIHDAHTDRDRFDILLHLKILQHAH
jgi:general secretion pathway protein L